VLAACAGWLVWRGGQHVGPDLWAWVAGLDASHRKEALVAVCVAGFLFFRMLDHARPESQSIESQRPDWNEDDEDEPKEEVRREAPTRVAQDRRPVAAPAPVETAEPPEPPGSAQGVGLPVGSPAPAFELPGITGEKRSLQTLLQGGTDLLLVFSSPFCEPCHALIPHLGRWSREQEGKLNIVLVSRGNAGDNIPKLKGFDSTRVLLQRGFRVAEAYDVVATPTGVLVSADGLIRSELAVGRGAIQELIASWSKGLSKD
jgi:thiol-disulfide isomerase/thioredoxin